MNWFTEITYDWLLELSCKVCVKMWRLHVFTLLPCSLWNEGHLVWLLVVQFLTAASQPHHIIIIDINLLMPDWMEIIEVGHPRLQPILLTSYKLTCCITMSSVLLLHKELKVSMSGQQTTRSSYHWMVLHFLPIKKTILTR